MRVKTTNVEHTEDLGIPTLAIVFINIARMRLCMHSETSNRATIFFIKYLGLVSGEGIVASLEGS